VAAACDAAVSSRPSCRGGWRTILVSLAVLVAVAAGCSSSPSAGPGTTGTHASTSGSAASTNTGRHPAAENLTISNTVRAQLIAALAAEVGVPTSEYTGFEPGLTYYALDTATGTYWAGAAPMPAPSTNPNQPTQAQVASQDDGAYDVYEKPPGGQWKLYATGATGQDTACGVTVPPAVLAVWGWAPGSCRPAGV
jgi:hypothetical protein